MNETNETTEASEPKVPTTYRDGFGLTVTFNSTTELASTYNLMVDSMVEGELPHLAALIVVMHADRNIVVTSPGGSRNLETKGIASWTFDEKDGVERKRINGASVARYVLPRAGRLLALLYATES